MKKVLMTLSLLLVTVATMAVPAKKGLWKTITLDDGTEVKALLKGDEFGHYWLTANGKHYMSIDGKYQEETPAIRQAVAQRRAQAQKHRAARLPHKSANGMRRAPASHLGQKKGLILLVNFQDTKFRSKYNQAFYNNVANTPGYTDSNGFQGSVADYFKDQSHGQFELTFDVIGPVTVSKDASYYGQNDGDGNDMHPEEMVMEAVNLAKEQVTDWKQYDWDSDGNVDQVMIIYAGQGEASGGDESTIWPHEYQLSYASYYDPSIKKVKVANGLYVDTYAVANEGIDMSLYGGSGYRCDGIGTICHEFSHCLGLPDMYDVSDSGYYGMGCWSLMDQGSYNGDGFIPAGYSSYDKYSIGWITPTELSTQQATCNMKALTDADDVYIIKNAAHPDEYYLIENRQQKSWDTYVPTHGMLVLHVDYDEDIWFYNLLNSYSDGTDGFPVNDHERCTIFHADGMDKTGELYAKMDEVLDSYYNATTDAEADRYVDMYYDLYDQYNADILGDVYPQTNNNQLSNTSTPRTFLYHANTDGRKLMNISITDIKQNANGTISFKFTPDNSGTEEGDNTEYGQRSGTKPGVENALFYESFDGCDGTGGNDGLWSGTIAKSTFTPDNDGWTATNDKAYGAYKCAKFGASSQAGTAISPLIAVNGTCTLSFKAGAWNKSGEATTLKVLIVGGTISNKEFTMTKGAFTDFSTTITANGNVKLTFTSEGRFFLDEVLVTNPDITAIRNIEMTHQKKSGIYTLDGRYVGTDFQQLGRGLYILNGKKIVK